MRVSVRQVEEKLRTFKSTSAPGPSGLTPDVVNWMTKGDEDKLVASALAGYIEKMVGGGLPTASAPYWAGAVLVALLKEGNDVRPIAIGEFYRRLAGKVAMEGAKASAREVFMPYQVSVAVSSGAEAVVRSLRQFMRDHRDATDYYVLEVDVTNAFNCINRDHMLKTVTEMFPSLARFAYWLYGTPSRLIYGKHVILSEQGVQQGDPLGGLFFCCGIHGVVKRTKEEHPDLSICVFFADDGHLAGPLASLGEAFKFLRSEFALINLSINVRKSLLFPTNFLDRDESLTEEADEDYEYDITAVQARPPTAMDLEEVVPFSQVRDHFPPEVKLVDSLIALGVPLGSTGGAKLKLKEKLAKIERFVDKLVQLGDAQIALLLFRECGPFSRMVYLMRSLPRSLLLPTLRSLDALSRGFVERLIGEALTDDHHLQSQIKVPRGGLGHRSLEDHHSAAFVAATTEVAVLVHAIYPRGRSDPDLATHVAEYNTHVPAASAVPSPPLGKLNQKLLSKAIDKAKFEQLRTNLASTAKYPDPTVRRVATIRLHGLQAKHGSDFLLIRNPNPHRFTALSDRETKVALRLRLGLDLTGGQTNCPRPHSPAVALAPSAGHHLLSCHMGEVTANDRHTGVAGAAHHLTTYAGMRTKRETPHLLPDSAAGRRRPADLLIEGAIPTCVDVSVTSSVQNFTLNARYSRAGLAAQAMEKKKIDLCRADCERNGLRFTPLVVETLGGFGKESYALLERIASQLATQNDLPRRVALSIVFGTMSAALQRHNARMVLSRLPFDAPPPAH